jgi:hypothetical protein
MPRGSRPGERRGGRQRGTPNKKTLLKNAVFCAAAADPNRSPLDFMLALMRDPQVPTDVRVDMAAAAAPYVHAKPQAPPRVRTNPMDSRPITGVPDQVVRKMEGALNAPQQSGDSAQEPQQSGAAGPVGEGGPDLSPMDFLLRMMNDPEATPKQRIRAARVAARYKHIAVPPDKLPAVDEYGFAISNTLAKGIRDDYRRLERLYRNNIGSEDLKRVAKEIAEINARSAEQCKFLPIPPPGYSPDQDEKRNSEFRTKDFREVRLTMAEDTEEAHVLARLAAYRINYPNTPEGRAYYRAMQELLPRHENLSEAERNELDQLVKAFPRIAKEFDAEKEKAKRPRNAVELFEAGRARGAAAASSS